MSERGKNIDADAPTDAAKGSVAETFLAATCGALVAAAWYVGSAWFRFAFGDQIVNVSRDIAWMGPAATLFFFLVLAVPASVIARRISRDLARRLAIGGFGALAIFSVLLPYSAIARYASLLLAAGAGVAIARLVAKRPATWLRILRATSVVLGAGFVAASLIVAVGSWIGSRNALRALPAAAPGAPNVLLIVLDAVRADVFSSYGYVRRTTPHFDAIAREGALFEAAASVAPWTLPSHHSMLTGEYQFPGGPSSNFLRRPPNGAQPVITEMLRDRGYETAGFVANLFYTAWDSEVDRGFIHYRDYPRTLEQTLRSSSIGQTQMIKRFYREISLGNVARLVLRPDFYMNPKPANSLKSAQQVTDEFFDWLSGREERPFFVLMNYFDAHEPYAPPPPYNRIFSAAPSEKDLYDGAVSYMDAQIERIFAELRRRNLLDNTVVVVTSDHGELFGERGLSGHHSNLYYRVLHVPLIMRFPKRVPAGSRIEQAVSLRDLAATIADLTDLPQRGSIPGVSLAGHWSGEGIEGSPLFSAVEKGVRVDSTLPFAKGDMVSLMDRQWHYIRNTGTGKEELFRYRDDPAEATDLLAAPESEPILRQLRTQTDSLVRSRGKTDPQAPSGR